MSNALVVVVEEEFILAHPLCNRFFSRLDWAAILHQAHGISKEWVFPVV